MNRHICVVYGSPVAQGRPRFTVRNGYVHAYDPVKSRTWKEEIKAQILAQIHGRPQIHDGALRLLLFFYLHKPKSLPKKVKHHIRKPDCDNLAKAVKDGLRSILYRDDSQIVEMLVRKTYGDPPRVVIALEQIADGTELPMPYELLDSTKRAVAKRVKSQA